MMDVLWRFVLAVSLLYSISEAEIRCKDKDKKDIDWFIIYKLRDSFNIYYLDSSMASSDYTVMSQPEEPLKHQDGVLANTLEPYFSRNPGSADSGYIAYNDNPPRGAARKDSGRGKGFVMMDKTSGFWLLHSRSWFPNSREKSNFYPEAPTTLAEIFICVTFKADVFEHIGEHLRYINAHSFEHEIPDVFPQQLRDAANGVALDPKTQTQFHRDLTSEGGHTFRSFFKRVIKDGDHTPAATIAERDEKNTKEGDLYVIIAENIGSDLSAQTGGIQKGKSASYCPNNGKHVLNVKDIKVADKEWPHAVDHSRWCVSKDKDWTCFGDSNRSTSEYERYGGALCINSKHVADTFRSFIKKVEDCPTDSASKKAKTSPK